MRSASSVTCTSLHPLRQHSSSQATVNRIQVQRNCFYWAKLTEWAGRKTVLNCQLTFLAAGTELIEPDNDGTDNELIR
jgi:hypothetical protein